MRPKEARRKKVYRNTRRGDENMGRDLTQPFDNDTLYVLDGVALNTFRKAALRLYTENRFKNGDEMRDLAQAIDYRLGDAIPYKEESDH
jgi:DNA-binding PadR family transcriptional regulator